MIIRINANNESDVDLEQHKIDLENPPKGSFLDHPNTPPLLNDGLPEIGLDWPVDLEDGKYDFDWLTRSLGELISSKTKPGASSKGKGKAQEFDLAATIANALSQHNQDLKGLEGEVDETLGGLTSSKTKTKPRASSKGKGKAQEFDWRAAMADPNSQYNYDLKWLLSEAGEAPQAPEAPEAPEAPVSPEAADAPVVKSKNGLKKLKQRERAKAKKLQLLEERVVSDAAFGEFHYGAGSGFVGGIAHAKYVADRTASSNAAVMAGEKLPAYAMEPTVSVAGGEVKVSIPFPSLFYDYMLMTWDRRTTMTPCTQITWLRWRTR